MVVTGAKAMTAVWQLFDMPGPARRWSIIEESGPRNCGGSKMTDDMNGRSAPGSRRTNANALQELTTTIRPRPAAFHELLAKWRSFQQLKAVIELDGLVEVTTMRNLSFGLRRLLSLSWALPSGRCLAARAEALRGGLWQKSRTASPGFTVGRRSQRRLQGLRRNCFPSRAVQARRICSECTDDRRRGHWLGISFVPPT